MDSGSFGTPLYENNHDRAEGHSGTETFHEEEVERRLANFVFVREERDREVRLTFRDVPPAEITLAFRAAGAALITIGGERLPVPAPANAPTDIEAAPQARKRRNPQTTGQLQGEVLLRYFFALGETVYTATFGIPSGVVGSIAAIYPSAALNERELSARLGIVFTN
jgi:hypothetical protein